MQVVLGAESLLANGGIMAPSGNCLVALAAQRHAVPYVVLVGLYKLSPLFPHDPSLSFNEFKVRCSALGPCTAAAHGLRQLVCHSLSLRQLVLAKYTAMRSRAISA